MTRFVAAIAALVMSLSPSLAQQQWSGIYAGAHLGGVWDTMNIEMNGTQGIKSDSMIGGVQVLGIYQTRSNIDLGIIADFDFGKTKGTTYFGSNEVDISGGKIASLRGIVGYSWNDFMPYITAGVATSRNYVSVPNSGTRPTTQMQFGYVAGVGLNYSLAKYGYLNTSIYGEYLRYTFPTQAYNIAPTFGVPIQTDEKVFKMGVNFKF